MASHEALIIGVKLLPITVYPKIPTVEIFLPQAGSTLSVATGP
jgi:hypothetical protein